MESKSGKSSRSYEMLGEPGTGTEFQKQGHTSVSGPNVFSSPPLSAHLLEFLLSLRLQIRSPVGNYAVQVS